MSSAYNTKKTFSGGSGSSSSFLMILAVLLLIFADLRDGARATVGVDFLKYHPPTGFQANARSSITDFLSKAAKARREELVLLRSHIRRLIDFRVGCFRKELAERRAARRERRKSRAKNRRLARLTRHHHHLYQQQWSALSSSL